MKTVSIGICAYNEEENIGRLLQSIIDRNYENFFLQEIIVVADGCEDCTEHIVKQFSKNNEFVKFYYESTRQGKSHAVDKILKESEGDYIIFIDGDTLPANGSLENMIEKVEDSTGAVVGKSIVIGSSIKDMPHKTFWELHHIFMDHYTTLPGTLYLLRNNVVDGIPHQIVNDDTYISEVLKTEGYEIIYTPEAETYIVEKNNLISHFKRRVRINCGHLQLDEVNYGYDVSSIVFFIVVADYLTKKPLKIHYLLLTLIMEFLAKIVSLKKIKSGKIPIMWDY